MKKSILACAMGLFMVAFAGAQITGSSSSGSATSAGSGTSGGISSTSLSVPLSTQLPQISNNANLAMSSPEYMVTPGDIYSLSFTRGFQQETLSLLVEGDSAINAGFMGRIQAAGMKFTELKELLIKKTEAAYPNSNPSLIIVSTGLFPVTIKGEITAISVESAWGLSRLSALIMPYLTAYSSRRSVKVISKDGAAKTYDLFKADRFGDTSQNPLLRPGDVIEVGKAARIVSVLGAVRKPGNYELLPGEGVRELIQLYGDGALVSANLNSVVLTHRANPQKPESESILFDFNAASLPELVDGDIVKLLNLEDYLPVIYIEGAIQSGLVQLAPSQGSQALTTGVADAKASLPAAEPSFVASPVITDPYGIVRTVFREGQRALQIMLPLKAQISNRADLKRSYIIRGQERLPIDLEKLLYQNEISVDVVLQPNDRIVIPYGYESVYVKGEVKSASSLEIKAGLRLNDVLKDNLTELSSLRDISITSEDGKVVVCDLFKAQRFGDLTQNPLLRPGDMIEVQKASRIVQIEGEVKRQGLYQLQPGEGAKELVDYYGDGPLVSANLSMAVLIRKASAKNPEGQTIVFDMTQEAFPELENGDVLRIPSQEEYLPVVYIEGAIANDQGTLAQTTGLAGNTDAYNIRRAVYRKDLLVSQVMRPLELKLSPRADPRHAYVARGQERIFVDLEKLLHFYNAADDVVLQPDDHIVVPYGLITAHIKGEVKQSVTIDVVSGLRLSDVLKENLTVLSSIRDIRITNQDGKVEVYDLFKAQRFGDLSQNPFIRPGDVIEVEKAERIVQIDGEVNRPGSYQLLKGEGIKELASFYGNGLMADAKSDSMVLTRKATLDQPDGESIIFDFASTALPEIANGDAVHVPSQEEYLPVVYIEGAIVPDQPANAQSGSTQSSVQDYNIHRSLLRKGQMISQIMRPLESKILSKADLRNAYIARGSARIAVDLEKLLHFYDPADDIVLQPDDHIVVPFGLTYVYVKGEVKKASAIEVTSQSRLWDIIKDLTTTYSSLRDIRVTSLDGSSSTYDMFKADRFGDMSQNPYIRPGDQIELQRAERLVQLDGQVHRPGTYQLLPNEGARELIEYYGDGALIDAKTDALVLTRKTTAENPEGESQVFDIAGDRVPLLVDGDKLHVPSRDEYLPIVYIEGALLDEKNPKAYGMQRTVYRKGELVSQAVRSFATKLSPDANLRQAYIARGTTRIAVDLEKLLFFYSPSDDVVLSPEDHIVIPFGLSTVTVKGEVKQASIVPVVAGLRLSDAIKDNLTTSSYMRDIQVTSADGKVAHYDLFKAARFGDLGQNPLLRPGDVIDIARAPRTVSISGEVAKPGSYQLLENEGVSELVKYYAEGVLPSAKTESLVLSRKATAQKLEGESIVFDLNAQSYPILNDAESIRVPSREEYLPVVYIEGAIAGDPVIPMSTGSGQPSSSVSNAQSGSAAASGQPASYSMLRMVYREGMTVSLILRPIKDKISASADLAHAFVLRKGLESQIPVDLQKLLYSNELGGDIVLRPDDKLVIPYGAMYVFVTGEVTKSSWVGITGLTRLRDVVTPLLTRYSSIRDVKVKTADGFEKTYDLFKADRYGDLSQDPFLRPGDEIRLSKLTNPATIQGEVKRPGVYQLLSGEGLKELIEVYAEGFTEKANTSRITLLHYFSDTSPVGEKLQFDYTASPNIALRPYDVVSVPSLQELLPVVWFEGAVGLSSVGSSPETSQRIAYNFVPGETASQAALNNRKLFSAVSDLAYSYIVHADGSQTPVNLAKFIYDYDLTNDVPLKANDTIIVPFRQFFVTVSGAVRIPGRYPYIPKRTWDYYIGLAGGFDTDKNSGQKITIYDVKSQKVAIAGREIQPEDNIVAESNSLLMV